jgi:putative transposase
MSSFTSFTYHVIFSTKYRHPSLAVDFRNRVWEYMGGIIREDKGSPIEIGGVSDHVHILAHLSSTIAASDVIRDVKASSSAWINDQRFVRGRFEWQVGYAGFTVSRSLVEAVRDYILNQEEHHRAKTFEEEYITFLERHGIQFERRYLFEKEFEG